MIRNNFIINPHEAHLVERKRELINNVLSIYRNYYEQGLLSFLDDNKFKLFLGVDSACRLLIGFT